MPASYTAFRDIHNLDDLLLLSRELSRNPATIKLPTNPYYAEICIWVNVRCGEDALFANDERTLLEGAVTDGEGWRLLLTPHGYLRFEGGEGEGKLVCGSPLPVHSVVNAKKEFRLGFSLMNYGWLLRHTPYAAESSGYSRIRLLAAPGPTGPLSEIGGASGEISAFLAPVPERLIVGANADKTQRFGGHISHVTAYNTGRVELFDAPRARSAARVVPVIPGGGGFEPRWIDDETIEVFTRPEFTQTSSYWVFLKIGDRTGKLRRLRVHTIWRGGVNMTPTFFCSYDRKTWRRIVPRRVWIGENGTDFRVEFDLTPRMARGAYIASCPPFGEEERGELLGWAREQRHTTVAEIGKSVEGRPIHLIRVAAGDDGPRKKGVAVVCGQHSPLEIMGGRVLQPIIKRLVRNPQLLEQCNFYFVPTVNVDCAHYGGNGLNANQRNTNRHWVEEIQPENAAVIEYFDGLKGRGQSIDFAMDIHAGGIFKNHVLMSMGDSDEVKVTRKARAEEGVWLDLLEEHAGLRRQDGRPLHQVRLRATDYFHQGHGATAFCLELSTCSYFDPDEKRTKAFGPEAFDKIAAGLVQAWVERFCG